MSSDAPPPPALRDASPVVARIRGVGKCYHVYARPRDRLRQFLARAGRRYYREFWALRDVELELVRGETLGIVGRNGAGKSTLLQIIAGTLRATTGSVDVEGRVTALLELGAGFNHEFTGRDNVYLAGAILGLDRQAIAERFARIEAFAEIGEFIDRQVKTYSKGMFARLAFAVYANLDPDIFIVDEALAVGDAKFRHKCMYRFRQMQEQGVSILYVSHDAPSMKQICDRVVWIDRGQLRMVGDPNTVVDAYLTELFHGENAIPTQVSTGDANGELGDDRAGTGHCRFETFSLRDAAGASTGHLTLPGACTLHVSIVNHALDPASERLQTGFWIRNSRGTAITGTNSSSLDIAVPTPAIGERVELVYRCTLPALAPGSYSLTLMASRLTEDGSPALCDRLVNAIVFRVSTSQVVHGMVGMDCTLEIVP